MSEQEYTSQEKLKELLRAPLPAEAIKEHPTRKYISAVNSMYVIERLNDVFGESGWIAEYHIVEANPQQAMVVVSCEFSVPAHGIRRFTFGGNDNPDRGDAYKGACTDALTKAASQIGIAQDVYKGMYDKQIDEAAKPQRKRTAKPQYVNIEGVVSKYQHMSPNHLWLEVNNNGTRILASDEHCISLLQNSLGKKIEINCLWGTAGRNKVPVLTVTGVVGVYEVMPATPVYVPIDGDGNQYQPASQTVAFQKPKTMQEVLEISRDLAKAKREEPQGVPVSFEKPNGRRRTGDV